ncbi:netrin receptor UNC5C-like [Saccoglossus kowalevskii]
MEKICASNFIIFIFSKDTIYSNVCRTAVHYTRRVGKAYVGIFCNGVLHHDSWQQRAIVPQNKMTLDKPAKDMFKVIRKITNQLPKVNLALIPGAYCVETQLIAEFNKFANSCEIGDVFIRDNFVGSVFDEQGGHLEVPPGEVVMYIPPGSIESGVKQPVYMYVSEYKYGEIHPGKSVLTPVVNCGPDEATFKKDILLACPHSAVKEESWKFTSLRRAACGVWENLPERSVLVNSGYVFLFLNHFTPYLTEGEGREDQSAERRIKIGLNGIFCKDTNFKIKIGAWNDVNQTQTSSWTECRPLHISANDTELRIDIKDLDETWKQRGGNSIKIIRVADISSSEEVHETYTFQYIKPGEKPDDFYCVVTATLENSKYEKEIELDVSRSADTHTVKAEDYTTKSNEEIFRALNPKWKPLGHQISAALWRKLCENLDVDRSGITDWKAIAYKLELNHDQVCNLNNSDSPTSNLLLFYFGLSRIRGWPLIHALEGLAHMCDNVKNHEARDDINNYITIRGNGN